MDELEAIRLIGKSLDIGDDCAVLEIGGKSLLLTTDMLHESSDFPKGFTAEMVGWRSAAVNLSDIAAMGGKPMALVVALGSPKFTGKWLRGFVKGALKCCNKYGCRYAGGDLDRHRELTVVGTAIGIAERPVGRGGAHAEDLVCVTGVLGKSFYGSRLYKKGRRREAFNHMLPSPRIKEGLRIAKHASAMMDISDGLARSLHQMGWRSKAGFTIDFKSVPLYKGLEGGLYYGDDYELLFTVPKSRIGKIKDVKFSVIGKVTKKGVYMEKNGRKSKLPDRGWTH